MLRRPGLRWSASSNSVLETNTDVKRLVSRPIVSVDNFTGYNTATMHDFSPEISNRARLDAHIRPIDIGEFGSAERNRIDARFDIPDFKDSVLPYDGRSSVYSDTKPMWTIGCI